MLAVGVGDDVDGAGALVEFEDLDVVVFVDVASSVLTATPIATAPSAAMTSAATPCRFRTDKLTLRCSKGFGFDDERFDFKRRGRRYQRDSNRRK